MQIFMASAVSDFLPRISRRSRRTPIRHDRQQGRWDAWPRADRPVLVRSACPSAAGLPVGDV